MVNRGPGGPRRPAPPAPSNASAPAADDGEEKTSALNLAEIDLDAIDAAPARPTPPAPARPVPSGLSAPASAAPSGLSAPAPAAPARPAPPARPAAAPASDDDEPEEKTAAFDVEAVQRAMAARSAPAPQPASRPTPAPTAPARPAAGLGAKPPAPAPDDDEPEEKTAAFDVEAVQRAMAARNAPAAAPAAARPTPAAPSGLSAPVPSAPARPTPPAPARPAPVAAQPKAAPAPAPDDDEPEEKTAAFDVEAVQRAMAARSAPAAATPAPARPAPAAPARPAPAPAGDDDEPEEKTAAFDVEAVQRAMAARGAPGPARPAAPAPAPARPAAPAPARPAAPTASDDEPEEKTAAFDVEAFDKAQKARAAAPAPARPAARPPADEDGFERTMAVNLDDIQGKGPGKADKTSLPEESIPEVKAPPGKKLPEPKGAPAAAAKPAEAPKATDDETPSLFVKAGQDAGKSYPVTRDLSLVGRGLDADIVINDPSASRKHFNIVRTLSGWKLVDLGSGNGTKVDGAKVPEIALKTGMVIELGSTKLEWRGPGAGTSAAAPAKAGGADGKGAARVSHSEAIRATPQTDDEPPEKTQFADIAALEIDPAWETRKASQRKDVDPTGSAAGETEEEAPKSSGAGKKIALVGGLVLLLGGGFVAADKFAGLGIIFPKEKPAEKKADDSGGDAPADGEAATGTAATEKKAPAVDEAREKARKDAVAKVEAGQAALGAGKFLAAKKAFSEALDLDDGVEGASDGAEKAGAGVKKLVAAVKLQKALAGGDFNEAASRTADALAAALPSKDWTERAAPVVSAAATAHLVTAAFDLLEGGKAADAKPLMEAALKLAPDNEQVKLLKEAVDAGAGPTADLRFVMEGEPKADDKVAATDMAPAFEAYLKGDEKAMMDFHGKVQNAGEASVRDVKRSMAYENATTCARTRLTEGEKQIKAIAFDKALPELLAARICDAMLARKRADVITATLATTALSFGKANGAQPEFAATLFKHAIALKPDLADAKVALDGLAAKATEALDKARAAKDDPDAALAAALAALTVAAPDSAAWKDAVALVDGLLAP
jgi:hypothetical protein